MVCEAEPIRRRQRCRAWQRPQASGALPAITEIHRSPVQISGQCYSIYLYTSKDPRTQTKSGSHIPGKDHYGQGAITSCSHQQYQSWGRERKEDCTTICSAPKCRVLLLASQLCSLVEHRSKISRSLHRLQQHLYGSDFYAYEDQPQAPGPPAATRPADLRPTVDGSIVEVPGAALTRFRSPELCGSSQALATNPCSQRTHKQSSFQALLQDNVVRKLARALSEPTIT